MAEVEAKAELERKGSNRDGAMQVAQAAEDTE